jgi:hypothetical protein
MVDLSDNEDDHPRKSRRELPPGAVAHLKAWLLSPEHFTHPYPTPQDQVMLMQKTGIDKKQLKNWFTNARRRIWKPMLKKQLEAGKLVAHGGQVVQQQNQSGMVMVDNGMLRQQQQQQGVQSQQFGQQESSSEMYANFQQAQAMQGFERQDQGGGAGGQQPTGYDQFGNPIYQQQQMYPYQQQEAMNQQPPQQQQLPLSNSIGSLPPPNMNPNSSTASLSNQMIKTDSHAVLMELFARDQYLVRQAASSKSSPNPAQNPNGDQVRFNIPPPATSAAAMPMQKQHSVTFDRVPTLSSWPHFSSVSSLNNLGGIQGVKSITNLSAADLSSQGNLNKMGNLAQVKSIENMGRGDSYAFLEVFFDDKSGMSTSSSQRGIKREREDDDAIGLSLDGDDGGTPVAVNNSKPSADEAANESSENMPSSAPVLEDGGEDTDGGQLKRAYDDALAARGLIAVRRSCEKLTDLALPAKMQRTLSQEYLRQHAQGQSVGDFFNSSNSQYAPQTNQMNNVPNNGASFPVDTGATAAPAATGATQQMNPDPNNIAANASVQVPSSTQCALCNTVSVDTQLRPCGHMFHGRCLKPSLQNTAGPPKCPMCGTSMQSAILAVPTAAEDSTSTTSYI